MQNFYIKEGATLPTLRLELIKDGRYDFLKSYEFNNAIQNADVTFSMVNNKNGNIKIYNKPCSINLSEDSGCEDRYIIEYKWTKYDTNAKGQFTGNITIDFKSGLIENGNEYPAGRLIGPIHEELQIFVI